MFKRDLSSQPHKQLFSMFDKSSADLASLRPVSRVSHRLTQATLVTLTSSEFLFFFLLRHPPVVVVVCSFSYICRNISESTFRLDECLRVNIYLFYEEIFGIFGSCVCDWFAFKTINTYGHTFVQFLENTQI